MMTAVHEFEVQQGRLLQQFGVKAESIFLENVPAVEGRVHVLKCGEGPAVVMVPGFGDPAAMWAPLMAALKAGARGYVLKGVTARDLANAVRVVAGGDIYISPALAGGILFELTAAKQDDDPLTTLTDRERDILSLVAEGLTNREIGENLHLAEKTIKHYMTNVLQKLHVRSRVEAALLAQKHGLAKE